MLHLWLQACDEVFERNLLVVPICFPSFWKRSRKWDLKLIALQAKLKKTLPKVPNFLVEIWETRNSLIALQIRMKKSLLKEILIALQIKISSPSFERDPGSEIQSRQVLFRPLWVDGEARPRIYVDFSSNNINNMDNIISINNSHFGWRTWLMRVFLPKNFLTQV